MRAAHDQNRSGLISFADYAYLDIELELAHQVDTNILVDTDAFADCVANMAAQDVEDLADLDDDGDEREKCIVFGRDAQRVGREAHHDDVHLAVDALREPHHG